MKNPFSNVVLLLSTIISFCFLLGSCQDEEMNAPVENPEEFVDALPREVLYPANNPYTPEKEELGRLLYWDPVLSGNKDVACVSCHHPSLGYADGLVLSQGVDGVGLGMQRSGGVFTRRNAPTVINTAYNGIDKAGRYDPETAPMFWDNRAASLEEQALLPMLSMEEMKGTSIAEEDIIDTIIQRLNAIPEYQQRFGEAFGSEGIDRERMLAAIATFERSITANNSRFDQYMRGNNSALNSREIGGLNAFINVGCADCHSGPMFSDFELHTIGVQDNVSPADRGASNRFDFRTPTLRNLNVTAPYMHNGAQRSLEEVLEFYEEVAEGDDDQRNPNVSEGQLDPDIRDLELDEDQIGEIIAFLNTLNDNSFDQTIPDRVPSGLPVGGNIH